MTFQDVEEKFKHKLDAFAEGGYRFSDDFTLYKQSQQEAFQGYKDGIAKGEKHGYIELPTGVGKTALFISLVKNYIDATNGDENAPRVLIAVPTEKLAVQTAQAFAKFMPDIAKTLEADGDKGQEIDWQKSDIGLQYGKMKHAHKKPKVLITTYQSLARDTANKTYPPGDFGFVIYDEGHVLTAPGFGKAVDKFHDSVQLAVTATPEYTETKAVDARLPHCYFQFPLAEAINRGDLCNVRPAIIKTGYKIDEALFQRFMEQQGGTPLNTQQLQQLLNQEARNKAVVETYLRGGDPDSGERYFGQNGMIFCTGIKHADAIAAQFTKAMGQGEGVKLQNWLDRENVELIASVHGKAEGQWLKKGLMPDARPDTRKYQGNREWYSEQEIFDLHEKGKILLLASVSKLQVGYDSPRDSLLFDLGDRFSKVAAVQIDGRAFRLDPENPYKTATVFNLMDENTQELYAKFPKMIPIYCAEVIEGADFRPPARRTGAQVRFKETPPGMDHSLQEAGFDVIANIGAVRNISRINKEKRDKANIPLPEKTEHWLSGKDMVAHANRGAATVYPLYASLREAWVKAKTNGDDTFSAEGMTFPIDKGGLFKSNLITVFCLHEDAVSQFHAASTKTDEWLTLRDMQKQVKRTTLSPVYDALQLEWEKAIAAGKETFSAEGITLSVDKAKILKQANLPVFCIHEDAVHFFRPAPEKTSEWLNKSDMTKKAGRAPTVITSAYEGLQSAWKRAKSNGEAEFTANGITLPTDKAGLFRKGSNESFCLHQDALEFFKSAPEKTSDWLGVAEMMAAAKRSNKTIAAFYTGLQAEWEKAKDSDNKTFSFDGITLPTDKAGLFKISTKTIFCIHKDVVDQFAPPEKTSEWLGMADLTTRARSSFSRINPLYKAMQAAWEKAKAEGENTFTVEGITIPTNKAGMFKHSTGTAFYLHEDMVPLFTAFPEKTVQWLSGPEMGEQVGHYTKVVSPLYKNLRLEWESAKAQGAETFTVGKITIPTQKAGMYRGSGTKPSFCLHQDVIGIIRDSVESSHSVAGGHAEKVGKRSIAPGSNDLKRTGRTLAKNDE